MNVIVGVVVSLLCSVVLVVVRTPAIPVVREQASVSAPPRSLCAVVVVVAVGTVLWVSSFLPCCICSFCLSDSLSVVVVC